MIYYVQVFIEVLAGLQVFSGRAAGGVGGANSLLLSHVERMVYLLVAVHAGKV